MSRFVLDIATTAIEGAEAFLPDVSPAGNLVDPVKIAADVAKKKAAQRETLALDLDLCRVSAIGYCDVTGFEHGQTLVHIAETEAAELALLKLMHDGLKHTETITFNGIAFDLAVLERRMLYAGLPSLKWNLDRYRASAHVDLLGKLSDYGKRPYRSLAFYCRRLGWSDIVKPLTGAQEATALADGQLEALKASVAADVEATKRLAVWMGVLQPSTVPA